MEILTEGAPELEQKVLIPWTFSPDSQERLKNIARDLGKTMLENRGVGIAEPQVGTMLPIIAMRADTPEGYLILVNPKITWKSEETCLLDEGCLSFPGLFFKVRRPKEVRVRWQDLKGNVRAERFGGLTARIVQHEVDHLDVVCYTKHASDLKIKMARRKLEKLSRKMTS